MLRVHASDRHNTIAKMAAAIRQGGLALVCFCVKTAIVLMAVISLICGYYTQRSPELKSFHPQPRQLSTRRALIAVAGDLTTNTANRHPNQTDPPVSTPSNMTLCPDIQLLPNHSVPMVALHSFPGSGNTWVRFMLEQATRIYTGSVYDDNSLYHGGFLGEMESPSCGCTVVVKVHFHAKESGVPWKGAIYVMRNPYDAILAERNRQEGENHTGVVLNPNHSFKGSAWESFVRHRVEEWRTLFGEATKIFDQLLIVHYEDLMSDAERELGRMLKFLEGISSAFTSRADIRCALQNTTGNFKRPKHKFNFDPYTPDLRQIMDDLIRHFLGKLRKAKAPLPPYASEYLTNSSKP